MDEIQLQLEALREIRGWGTWIVGIGGAVLAFAVSFSEDVRHHYVKEIKSILILGCIAFSCAISLIITVPSAIEELPIKISTGLKIMSFDLSGVFGYPILGAIPIFYVYVSLYISITITAFILLTILWRKLFQ
ncbi:hypothetical protein [Neorhizobium galegae]|uniref:hypothetical protein n=1 Tax=Neorhizobium galegae TaxID=399 RepID=UPI001F4165B7|nr:hypothetical protein [Neorhizobium galegae]UIK07508.1 hypothetical protein LZK81_11395 [Neorhizobium galegae]